MQDEAIGIAILNNPNPEEYGFLTFIQRYADGRLGWTEIPIIEESRYEQGKAQTLNHPLWAYRMEGDTLHIHPSVLHRGTGWHNSYSWSIKFIPATNLSIHSSEELALANPDIPFSRSLT